MNMGDLKKAVTLTIIVVVAVFVIPGCITKNEAPPVSNITNNITGNETGFITLDKEGVISQEACSERKLDDKIIILESKYCGACRVAVPRLKEIEKELNTEFIFLDLSESKDVERLKEFKILPRYTPTVLIGCRVYIGVKTKEQYKRLIEEFLE
jgi:thiol-disulfide isomerase/thioredoxin